MSQINLRISSGCNAVHTSSGIPGKRLCNNRNWTSHKFHRKQTLFRHRSSPLSSASCTRYATLGPPTTSCGCISCTSPSPESSQYCQVNNSNEEKKSKFSWEHFISSSSEVYRGVRRKEQYRNTGLHLYYGYSTQRYCRCCERGNPWRRPSGDF